MDSITLNGIPTGDYATDTEMREGLRQPFDRNLITVVEKGYGPVDTVNHAVVTNRLNQEAPGWTMSKLEVVTSADGHVLAVVGSMTIGSVTRWEVGEVEHKSKYGDELKKAYSDWIKRAAMRFGVALDLWTKEDLSAESEQRSAGGSTSPSPAGGVGSHLNPDTGTDVPNPSEVAAGAASDEAGSDPDSTVAFGEGAPAPENGSDPATIQQWADLLSLCEGHTTTALERLNAKSQTSYPSYRTAKQKATRAELEGALA